MISRANDERNKEYSVHLFGPELNRYVTKMYGSGFGGLVVSMLASGTQVRGLKPGRSRRIFRA
jgi:hypothetical protein